MGMRLAVGFFDGFDETVGTFESSQILKRRNKTTGEEVETRTNFTMERCNNETFRMDLINSYKKE